MAKKLSGAVTQTFSDGPIVMVPTESPPVPPLGVTAMPGCVLVNVPVEGGDGLKEYFSDRVDIDLLPDEKLLVRRIGTALVKRGGENRGGKPIASSPDVIRHILHLIQQQC